MPERVKTDADGEPLLRDVLPSSVLPVAGTTTIGGVKRNTGAAGEFVTGIASDGSLERGIPGASGDAQGFRWERTSSTSPGSGEFYYNIATLRINKTSADAFSLGAYLLSVGAGDYIWFSDGVKTWLFDVFSVSDGGSYVEYVASAFVGDIPAVGDTPSILFTRRGATGPAGTPGADGATGAILQRKVTSDATRRSSSVTIPLDDTIPQSSEGTAYADLDTTITPSDANNYIDIRVELAFWASALGTFMATLFRNSERNALATAAQTVEAEGRAGRLILTHRVLAGSTSAQTYKVRFGRTNGSITIYLNDYTTAYWGGTFKSMMTVEEVIP